MKKRKVSYGSLIERVKKAVPKGTKFPDRSRWNIRMCLLAVYAEQLARILLGKWIDVVFVHNPNWGGKKNVVHAMYGRHKNRRRTLVLNIGSGGKWANWTTMSSKKTDKPLGILQELNHVLLHEFAHEYANSHGEQNYHIALADLGAKLANVVVDQRTIVEGMLKTIENALRRDREKRDVPIVAEAKERWAIRSKKEAKVMERLLAKGKIDEVPAPPTKGDDIRISRKPKIHKLKTHPEPFEAILLRAKPYEIRKFDRDFRTGDVLQLEEWMPGVGKYTGRKLRAKISYISDPDTWGLPADVGVMGLTEIRLHSV